jgi:redox-sensing transcriptional repressor
LGARRPQPGRTRPRRAVWGADAVRAGGVQAILNYAPVVLKVPPAVTIREIDPVGAMQSMTYYLDD